MFAVHVVSSDANSLILLSAAVHSIHGLTHKSNLVRVKLWVRSQSGTLDWSSPLREVCIMWESQGNAAWKIRMLKGLEPCTSRLVGRDLTDLNNQIP